jgi:isoleucyl-tRNA synthetase
VHKQTPLKELVVFHHEAEFLDDIKVLSRYIQEELNVREVRLSDDEVGCGVKWKVDADWPVLGKKLRKDLPRLKKALPSVTSDDVKKYVETGKITIDGIDLEAGDLTTQRYVELPESATESTEVDAAQYSSDSNNDVVILLDTKVRPDFVKEAYARELINRVQKARKRAGCQATDDMEIYLAYSDAEAQELLNSILQEKAQYISGKIQRAPEDDGQRDKSRPVYYEDPEEHEEEVGGAKFRIVLLKHE